MYKYALKKCEPIGHLRLKSITTTHLQKIVNEHASHPRACQQLKLTLKQIYRAAIRDGIVPPINLAEDLQVPPYKAEEIRFFTDEELQTIKTQCAFQPLDKLYVDILSQTGMRPAEALALRWSDLDYKKHFINVQRAFEFEKKTPIVKKTKTNKPRIVPMSTDLEEKLKSSHNKSIYIFSRYSEPFTKSMFDKLRIRITKEVSRVIKDDSATLYSFRHSFATWLYYHGVTSGVISTKKATSIMGHSEKIFIERYTHINEKYENINTLRDLLNRDSVPKK